MDLHLDYSNHYQCKLSMILNVMDGPFSVNSELYRGTITSDPRRLLKVFSTNKLLRGRLRGREECTKLFLQLTNVDLSYSKCMF